MAASAPALTLPLDRKGKNEEDRELVRLSQNGTEAAFEELVRRHQQRVFALVGGILRRPEDVEDVAQQVFLESLSSGSSDLTSARRFRPGFTRSRSTSAGTI